MQIIEIYPGSLIIIIIHVLFACVTYTMYAYIHIDTLVIPGACFVLESAT